MLKFETAKKMKKSTIVLIVAVAILALIVGSLVVQKIAGTTHPMVFNLGIAYMDSESMGKSLPSGSIMLLHKKDSYAIDDIVTYTYEYQDETLSVTNRVFDSIGNVYYVKGDLSEMEDPEVHIDQIVGEVIFHFPSWIAIGLLVGLWLSFFATYGMEWFEKKSKKEPDAEPAYNTTNVEPVVKVEYIFHPESNSAEVRKIVDGKVVERHYEDCSVAAAATTASKSVDVPMPKNVNTGPANTPTNNPTPTTSADDRLEKAKNLLSSLSNKFS